VRHIARKGIRRGIAVAAAGFALLLAAAGANAAGQWDSLLAPESICPDQNNRSLPLATQAETMVCMHQYARAQAGRPQLHRSRKLRASAVGKAHDIKRCEQFSHVACGRDPFYWERRVGYLRGSAGAAENLELGSGEDGSVRSAMSSWLASDGHRSVLLDPRFDNIGIAVVSGRFRGYAGTAMWVVHLGYRN
jgi:uncharacterized protein YkwD